VIETEQSIVIDTCIDNVWNYVEDIRRWADLFPGCKACEVIDDHNSKWTLKVGAGGLVKTVNVLVHIEQWNGPGRVDFSYRLENEPVVGGGAYIATRKSDSATDIALQVRVEGSGPMAPMWEAVSRPLLPQLAKLFAGKLKTEIETVAAAGGETRVDHGAAPSLFETIKYRIKQLLRALFGAKTNDPKTNGPKTNDPKTNEQERPL
jgi:carbon monoxide dehydrogenase subunit G